MYKAHVRLQSGVPNTRASSEHARYASGRAAPEPRSRLSEYTIVPHAPGHSRGTAPHDCSTTYGRRETDARPHGTRRVTRGREPSPADPTGHTARGGGARHASMTSDATRCAWPRTDHAHIRSQSARTAIVVVRHATHLEPCTSESAPSEGTAEAKPTSPVKDKPKAVRPSARLEIEDLDLVGFCGIRCKASSALTTHNAAERTRL